MTAPIPTALTYADRPVCVLPDLTDTDQILTAGQTWTCPDCGITWSVSWQADVGGRPQPVWTT